MPRPYHHGSLRDSLVEATIEELRERGRDGFSLRRAATRAGVSHAAPAHHFGNAEGLLAAVRAEGFSHLVTAMTARRDAESDPFERLIATGVGYVDLALAEPALFDLMFGSASGAGTPSDEGRERASFDVLLEAVAAARGGAEDCDFWLDVSVAWSLVHGYAQLAAVGRLKFLDELGPDRDATLRALLRKGLGTAIAR